MVIVSIMFYIWINILSQCYLQKVMKLVSVLGRILISKKQPNTTQNTNCLKLFHYFIFLLGLEWPYYCLGLKHFVKIKQTI